MRLRRRRVVRGGGVRGDGAGRRGAQGPDRSEKRKKEGKENERKNKREVERGFSIFFFLRRETKNKNSKTRSLFPPQKKNSKKTPKDVLDALGLDNHEIKLNHRGLLDGGLAAAGVPPSKFKAACSAIDKLDKEPWEAVRKELVDQKGIAEEVADRIKGLVSLRGSPRELVAKLREAGSPVFGTKDGAVEAAAAASGDGGEDEGAPSSSSSSDAASARALDELEALAASLEALGITGNRIVLDLSLARGLDYYTGV